MNAQYNVNKHVQQLEVQVTKLGKATELTWGPAGSHYEGPMCNPRPSHWGRSEVITQVTELGTATELTLGLLGMRYEGAGRPARP